MIKFEDQLTEVESAMPLARARTGKISAPRSHGVGPHLREGDERRQLQALRKEGGKTYDAPKMKR